MSEESSLELYLRQIHCVPLLTEAREKEFARLLIRKNDPAAREELIGADLRLVVCIARRYVRRGISLQDLIEEGNIGLLKAVEAFNPEMNVRFSVYASLWIVQAIRRASIKTERPIHIPTYMIEMIARWKRTLSELECMLGREPGFDELAAHMGISIKKARLVDRVVRGLIVVSEIQAHEIEGVAFAERIGDDHTRSPDNIVLEEDAMLAIRMLFRRIDQREAQILRMRFGLEGNQPRTLREIGQRVGLSRERVRQIEDQALGKLKAYLSKGRIPRPEPNDAPNGRGSTSPTPVGLPASVADEAR